MEVRSPSSHEMEFAFMFLHVIYASSWAAPSSGKLKVFGNPDSNAEQPEQSLIIKQLQAGIKE